MSFIYLTNYSSRQVEMINTAFIVEIYETGRSTMLTMPNTFFEASEKIGTISEMIINAEKQQRDQNTADTESTTKKD